MTTDEAGLEDPRPAPGGKATAWVLTRPNGAVADCCNAAPSVLEFDTAGKLLRAWGGPADPGWLESHCRAADGCIWPNSEHGIYIDQKDNVWIGGNGAKPVDPASRWTTHKDGGDGFVLKFDMNGNFKMRIGGTPTAPNSNDTDGGINGTPLLYLPADMVVDPSTNRLYIADGYGNRRILIVDADTGKYIGHFGAYGANPVDDAAAAAGGRWMSDRMKGNRKPAFFRNPVHCVKIADDGKIYVCDRGNDRIQVFDSHDPALGKPCSNPDGEAGKCGFLAEQFDQRQHRDRSGHARHLGVDELLQGQGAELPVCRRQFQHDHLYAQPQQPAGARSAGPLAAAMPASSTGCTRSAWTATATSIPPKWIPESASRNSCAMARRDAAVPDR